MQNKKINNNKFQLVSNFLPSGDQPQAIQKLINGLNMNKKNQVLLGVTGSGKTFTIANVINEINRPTLILSPNKTLASQLYTEMKNFFPFNAVEYFVSYYDYYKPESYIPKADLYFEKVSSINDEIDRMRHAATVSLFERNDVIIVASVSAIYGISSPEIYGEMSIFLSKGENHSIHSLLRKFSKLEYNRNDMILERGNFRSKGDVIEIFPAHYVDKYLRISFFGDEIEKISSIDSITNQKLNDLNIVSIFPNSHYVVSQNVVNDAIKEIKIELEERLNEFLTENKLVEHQRLIERVSFDLDMMHSTGSCSGIENYSRYFSGRSEGEPPPTLFEYLPPDALIVVDESHIAIPQLRAMYVGDQSRKGTLSKFGFRLPSCKDNRPLKFTEWEKMRGRTIFVSATPGEWEISESTGVKNSIFSVINNNLETNKNNNLGTNSNNSEINENNNLETNENNNLKTNENTNLGINENNNSGINSNNSEINDNNNLETNKNNNLGTNSNNSEINENNNLETNENTNLEINENNNLETNENTNLEINENTNLEINANNNSGTNSNNSETNKNNNLKINSNNSGINSNNLEINENTNSGINSNNSGTNSNNSEINENNNLETNENTNLEINDNNSGINTNNSGINTNNSKINSNNNSTLYTNNSGANTNNLETNENNNSGINSNNSEINSNNSSALYSNNSGINENTNSGINENTNLEINTNNLEINTNTNSGINENTNSGTNSNNLGINENTNSGINSNNSEINENTNSGNLNDDFCVIYQEIRPTGLLDPKCEVRKTNSQIDDVMEESRKTIQKGGRILITVLTKKMAEYLSEYLNESGFKAKYIHSEINTFERVEIINDLRNGKYDILIGINLLREGLDIPECELVLILDADKEGYLRSKQSLIQTIGRAARNENGRVIFYGDRITRSMEYAILETERRRKKQHEHNLKNNITPRTINKKISNNPEGGKIKEDVDMNFFKNLNANSVEDLFKIVKKKELEMKDHAKKMNFEEAIKLRNEVLELKKLIMELE